MNKNIEDQSIDNVKNGAKKTAATGKKVASTAKKAKKVASLKAIFAGLKAILAPIAPYLLAILIIMAVLLLIMLVIFWAAPQGKLYTTTKCTAEDERLLILYKDLADENNIKDRWLVPGESDSENTWYPKVATDSGGGHGAKNYQEVLKDSERTLNDYWLRDLPLLETFGQIHTGNIFYIVSNWLDETSDKFKAGIAAEIRPYLYYKESTITKCCPSEDEDGDEECSTENIFLLVEAYTIQGHYLYEHEWQTEVDHDSG